MRFLFCALASHGFVYPAIAIARELQQRGHDVAFVTGKAFAQVLAETDIKRIPFGAIDNDSFTKRFFGLVPEIVRQVKHIRYACDFFSPDVMVATPLTIGPLIESRHQNIPVAVIGLAAYLWPTRKQTQTKPQTDQDSFRKHIHDGLIEYYLQACQIFGIAPPLEAINDYQNTPLLGDIYLLRSVPELQGAIDLLPERVHFAGACQWEPQVTLNPELANWLQQPTTVDLPLVFVQHGTHLRPGVPDFLPNLLQAVTDLPVRVVVAASHGASDSYTLPKNVHMQGHIPHSAILPYADAVVALGSTNPVLTTLAHGLPMLLIPNAGEELFVAELCEQAGVAISRSIHNSYRNEGTPENVTPQKLREAVQEILSNVALRENARHIQTAFRQTQQNEEVSQLLEMLAIEQRPLFRDCIEVIDDLSPMASACF